MAQGSKASPCQCEAWLPHLGLVLRKVLRRPWLTTQLLFTPRVGAREFKSHHSSNFNLSEILKYKVFLVICCVNWVFSGEIWDGLFFSLFAGILQRWNHYSRNLVRSLWLLNWMNWVSFLLFFFFSFYRMFYNKVFFFLAIRFLLVFNDSI